MVTVDEVRELALQLPRSYEVFVRGRLKFRVGQIVYLAFSRDETVLGFAFPKEWRNVLLESEPDKFLPPDKADERYQWLQVRLSAIDAVSSRSHGRSHCAVEVLHTRNHFCCKVNILLVQRREPSL